MISERFTTASELLHNDNAHQHFERGMVELRAQAATSPEVLTALKDWTWDRYQLSDGLVESDVALQACRLYNEDRPDIDSRCRQLTLNHFAIAGFADDAVAHMVGQLSSP